jgi:glycosyltransferase involved in cell wall biosynthesis
MKRVAFVIQRYGLEVMGGSELHCRLVAERLAQRGYECTIFTTTARDYITWKNEYESGESILNQVVIKRYPVEKERNIDEFNKFSDWIFHHHHSKNDEEQWMEQQGPYSPDLIEALRENQADYDCFVFFTYLYFNTYWGLKAVTRPKALVPTAHDEPALYLEMMKEVFAAPQAFIFNTQAEKRMLTRLFNLEGKYQDVVGVGVDIAQTIPDQDALRTRYGLVRPYLLYAGRIEPGKGCQELMDYFQEYSRRRPGVDLVLIGKKLMDIPPHHQIKYLGFVSPEDKTALMKYALVTIHPSHFESLCMAALESLSLGTPILVQEQTEPLKDHCRLGQAGLYYSNQAEFFETLDLLLADERLRERLGLNGRAYVEKNYSWEIILEKYRRVFEYLGGVSQPVE